MHNSRLNKNLARQTIRNILLTLAGIIILLVVSLFFGTQLLINLSLGVDKSKNNQDTSSNNDTSYVAPPVLDPSFDATNSARINISGFSLPNLSVRLYVNGKYFDKISVEDDKSFIFKNVRLEDGQNEIVAKALTDKNKESDSSNILNINYLHKPPALNIENPSDGQSFSKENNSVKITGKTDSGVRILVNNFWAMTDDQGNFTYIFKLTKGENKIALTAIDEAGNKAEKEIKVNYSD